MAFGEEKTAPYILADFSDSVKIIGEFNINEENALQITDENKEILRLESIRTGIDNMYAYEILEAILP